MRINTLFYCLWQGIRNTFRNKWFTLASVATISACLFLFGLFYAILTNFQHIVKTAEEGVSVTAFLDEGVSDERVQEISDMISKRVEVREADYVSADQTWETFKADYLGEYSEGFTENPLSDCAHFEIYMSDVSMQPELVSYLESIQGIRKVNKSAVTAQALTGINSIVGYVTIGIIAILFAVSIFLISNTVTIGISVRKEEIQIMKYIGATDFFVRAPFVIEGMVIGFIGSLIPLAAVYVIYNQALLYGTEICIFVTADAVFAGERDLYKSDTGMYRHRCRNWFYRQFYNCQKAFERLGCIYLQML